MQHDNDSKHRSKSSRQFNFKNDHSDAALQQLCWVSIYKGSLQAVCKHQQSFLLSPCPSVCHIPSIISVTEDGREICALHATIKNMHLLPCSTLWGVVVPLGGGRDTWPSSRTAWSRTQRTALWQVPWWMFIQLESQKKQMHTLAAESDLSYPSQNKHWRGFRALS